MVGWKIRTEEAEIDWENAFVDMQDFLIHVDKDAEWIGDFGGPSVVPDRGLEDAEVEVINNDLMLTESSSDEDKTSTRRRSIRAIGRAQENSQARVESNPKIPTHALHEQLQRQYKVDLSKMKVFRAKQAATKQARGDYAGQYSFLRDYVGELRKHNPNTTLHIEVESEPNPHVGFLGLDGAFIMGPYPGQVLTAVGLDGNNHVFPVAYAVVEAENINSWTWFLSCLGDDLDLGINSNFTFITDRQKGALQAIAKLFPKAENRYCLRHVHENMKLRWRGKEFKDALWKCASATTVQEFNHAMDEFKSLNNECFQWLTRIPPQHWARSHFTGNGNLQVYLVSMQFLLFAIWDMRKNNRQIGSPESLVHQTYWLNTWREMYSFKIQPINGRLLWEKSDCPTTIRPPHHHVPIGRPKKKRNKYAVEDMVKGNKASRKIRQLHALSVESYGIMQEAAKVRLQVQLEYKGKWK